MAQLLFKFNLFITVFLILSLPVLGIEDIVLEPGDNNRTVLESVISSPYALGDYKGFRSKLEENGINIQSSYMMNAFVMNNREKGSAKGTYQGLYNLSVDFDTEKLKLYKGGNLHILYQIGNSGINSMQFLNSYSDANSYDPTQSINQLSELYYEQSIKNDLFNIKIGKQDANVDFQALASGFEFLNLSFSLIDNTPMPVFPSQQMGVRVRVKLPKDIYIQDGFYDGNLDIGATPKSFFTAENNYLNMAEIYKYVSFKDKEGKYLIGNWLKTGDYETSKNTSERNNYGFYAGFDQKLFNRFKDNSGGLNLFGQFGYAKNTVNDVPFYGGAGLVFKGITERRKDDSVGIAFGWHQFSKQLHDLEGKTSEKVLEVFYKIKITEFLYVQPDFQYIINPGGNQKNSFGIGIRSCIVF